MAVSTKDLGRWKPQDDLILITNVQQVMAGLMFRNQKCIKTKKLKKFALDNIEKSRKYVRRELNLLLLFYFFACFFFHFRVSFILFQTNDLTAVHLGVKFSCKFTLREVQERWYALLYDPVLSK